MISEGRSRSWVDRTDGPTTIDLICDFCGDAALYPNKGLGRATAAAWVTQHQHPETTPARVQSRPKFPCGHCDGTGRDGKCTRCAGSGYAPGTDEFSLPDVP